MAPYPAMQSWDGCDSLPYGSSITLLDDRDGKSYEISKFRDDNCWMVENLAYAGVDHDDPSEDDYCSSNGACGLLYWPEEVFSDEDLNVDMSDTICPNGWYVPSLLDYYYLDEIEGVCGYTPCYYDDYVGSVFWTDDWRGVYAGESQAYNAGAVGYYWTSTNSGDDWNFMRFIISDNSTEIDERHDGASSVRCTKYSVLCDYYGNCDNFTENDMYAPTSATITIPSIIYLGQTVTVSWSWSASTNVDGYILEGKCGTGNYTELYSGPNLSYNNNISGCTSSVQYRVKAYSLFGDYVFYSEYKESASRSVTSCGVANCGVCESASKCKTCASGYYIYNNTCGQRPVTPTITSCSCGYVAWSSVTGASSYTVYVDYEVDGHWDEENYESPCETTGTTCSYTCQTGDFRNVVKACNNYGCSVEAQCYF